MALIKSYQSHKPVIASDVFLAENATVIGEVQIGAQSSVWYFAVLRGDVGAIKIGERTNIQDHAMIHCTTGLTPTVIGNDVVVGHRAILHGCTVEDECLIGMGAIVLDEALVPTHTIVAAGALVPAGKQLESGYLYAGIPAKKIKPLTPKHIEMIREGASHYVENARHH
ncbi:gamma carbonic anhydrase family protein [Pontibacter sp. G13]|uniref:gamma carbonic anhydrase family protein n=1 Tax=Pontibacter sp. G13 TaxID=3074898 RepID=UPI002889513D|nr:gamma carbonic anhydrase family protein [Pontibacter sp. G13]WNJ16278.1 gamma carbonic anhydrase family protein [Pontibacter sp. G13]